MTVSDRKCVAQLGNQKFQSGQEFLQAMNEDPSKPINVKTLRQELH